MFQVNRNFAGEDAQLVIKCMKQCTTPHSVRGLGAKKQRNRSREPIEVVKAQNTNTTNSHKNVKKLGLSLIAGEHAKWQDTLKDSLVVSDKPKPFLRPYSCHVCWYLYEETENSGPTKSQDTDVNSSFIHNCQNLGADIKQPRSSSAANR